jgi:hypothetical protein
MIMSANPPIMFENAVDTGTPKSRLTAYIAIQIPYMYLTDLKHNMTLELLFVG